MLKIGGLAPCTTIDYPGELSAVIFCQGCPWRCSYCHNSPLLSISETGKLEWQEILFFLKRRKGLLDGVVFSGGEPTMQPRIVEAARMVKQLGFKVGLHTAGSCPDILAVLLPYLDWIGMDIKAPFEDYQLITGIADSGDPACRSAEIVRNSGVVHQFRTTVHPLLNEENRLEKIRKMVVSEWRSCLTEQRCNAIDTFVSKSTSGEKNGRSWING